MASLAIDIGGTKLEVGVVDDTGTVLERHRGPTPRTDDPEELFAALAALIGQVDGDWMRVGVGCGGPMARGGEHVSPLNIPAWREFPLRARLGQHLGVDVHVDNDAKAFALAEGWLGAARGVRDYLAMVVSTGVGGGIVSEGRLLDGATGNAGHIGHVYVVDGTEPWPRHPAGLLESEASGTAIRVRTGHRAARADDALRHQTGRLVGRAVASVANLLDLRLAVVAGSVALGFGEEFLAAAQEEIDRLAVLDHSRGTRIVAAGLGADGPVVGAAAVALRAEGVDVGVS
ncbi:MAG: ROK family protein [Acidimicrobiales bacterium]|nr:ROK family protein [Acidimicrobiales bacterium]